MNKRKCLVELCVSGKQLRWSKDVFAAKFNASYQVISSGEWSERMVMFVEKCYKRNSLLSFS